jgi:hypothetical protein
MPQDATLPWRVPQLGSIENGNAEPFRRFVDTLVLLRGQRAVVLH